MCKLAKYGNCDEETKDDKYCIFHKPNKNEQEAKEFYEKFLKRFKHQTEKIKVGRGKQSRYVFEEEMNCIGFVFPEIPQDVEFSFEYAIFKGLTWFNESIFEEGKFDGAIFKDDVMFHRAIFKEYTSFGDVLTETTFEKSALFDRATFKEFITFHAVFKGYACFVEATFEKSFSFGDSVHKKTIFKEEVKFDRATFKKSVIFGATFRGFASFIGVRFDGFTDFSIKNKQEKYKFYDKLIFLSAVFSRGINIDIPSEWFRLPQAEAEARRIQRLFYEKEGKIDDADRMFLLERKALRKKRVIEARGKGWPRYIYELMRAAIEYLLADLTCKYGTSWRRAVFLWIGTVVLAFPFLYSIFHGVGTKSFLDYIYFSIVTATTLGYGDFHPIGLGKILASVEAIFGMFMWAVYIAVFSRKYMR